MMVKIIGVSGIGGAGKSVLTDSLGQALNATTLFWDDFDNISKDPDDYIEWYKTSRDFNDWKYDSLADVLKQLKEGKKVICPATKKELIPTPFIVFDAPLGRKHVATGQHIDYLIFLDTPLDVALARRILRDFRDNQNLNVNEIFDELEFYITSSRPLYAIHYEDGSKHDLVVDGNLTIDELVTTIVEKLKKL